MMKKISPPVITFISMLLVLSACSTSNTSLYNVTAAQNGASGQVNYHSLMVLGLTEKAENRRKLEDALVSAMSEHDVHARASLELMSAETAVDGESVHQAVAGKDIQAVLAVKVVKVEESEFMKDPLGTRSWDEGGFDRGMEYFTSHEEFNINPNPSTGGLTTTSAVATMKVGVYELKTERFIWSANAQSRDPESAEDVINELIPVVISGLEEYKLIGK